MNFGALLGLGIIKKANHTVLWRSRGPLALLILQRLPPPIPEWACLEVGSSSPRVYLLLVNCCGSHRSSVGCGVCSHPIALGWGLVPHQSDDEEAIKTHISLCFED